MYKDGSLQSTEEELTAIRGNSTFVWAFQKSRGIEGGHLPGGCECSLLLTSLATGPIPTAGTKNKKRRYRDNWDAPIEIAHAKCIHNGFCTPTCLNRITVTKSSGKYANKIPSRIVFTLCNYVDQGIKLSHNLIKSVINHKPIQPNTVEWWEREDKKKKSSPQSLLVTLGWLWSIVKEGAQRSYSSTMLILILWPCIRQHPCVVWPLS